MMHKDKRKQIGKIDHFDQIKSLFYVFSVARQIEAFGPVRSAVDVIAPVLIPPKPAYYAK